MRRTKLTFLIGLILAAISAPSIVAQDAQSKPAKGDGDYVSQTGFKNKLFQIKHRDPNSLMEVLKLLGSGFKGATISVNQEYKTITVRDFPENLATMEEALGRLDVPEPARPDIEFRIYVLLATSGPGSGGDYPAELNDVISQLRNTFKYKDYSLMTTSVHRAKDGPAGINNRGVAEAKKLTAATLPNENPIFYNYELRPISQEASASGSTTVHIGMFSFEMRIPISIGTDIRFENIGFRTPVNLREGEKVVVGTTTMEDKGIVVVLSTKILK
jgi:hypothetical protein